MYTARLRGLGFGLSPWKWYGSTLLQPNKLQAAASWPCLSHGLVRCATATHWSVAGILPLFGNLGLMLFLRFDQGISGQRYPSISSEHGDLGLAINRPHKRSGTRFKTTELYLSRNLYSQSSPDEGASKCSYFVPNPT
jgi:hypothetical protein